MAGVKEITKGIVEVGKIADDLIESGEERQEQLSHRHEMDMINGTWLTKNIRPLTLVMLLFYWVVLIPLMESVGVTMKAEIFSAVKELSYIAFAFYFGSKGFEKVQVIKAKIERRKERKAARRND